MLVLHCDCGSYRGDYCKRLIDFLREYNVKMGYGDFELTINAFPKSKPNAWQDFSIV